MKTILAIILSIVVFGYSSNVYSEDFSINELTIFEKIYQDSDNTNLRVVFQNQNVSDTLYVIVIIGRVGIKKYFLIGNDAELSVRLFTNTWGQGFAEWKMTKEITDETHRFLRDLVGIRST